MLTYLNRIIGRKGYQPVRTSYPPIWLSFLNSAAPPSPLTTIHVDYPGDHPQNWLLPIPREKIITARILACWSSAMEARGLEHVDTPVPDRRSFQLLRRYYDNFQPKSVAELQGYVQNDPTLTAKQSAYLSSPALYATQPWHIETPDEMRMRRARRMKIEFERDGAGQYDLRDGWKTHGAVSERLLLSEYNRLARLYDSIRADGFDPRHGYLMGKVLLNGKDYRIQPLDGWHRTAVQLALGYTHLSFGFSIGAVEVIDRARVKEWPHVRSGLYSEAHALKSFDRFFG